MKRYRADADLPAVITDYGWRFHHLGIPTKESRTDEKYIEELKMFVSGFETSEFGIEWMRFENDSPFSDIIQTVPHLAFVVDDLEKAVEGRELIGEITSPSSGLRVAMILENGAPVELMEFDK